MSPEICTEWRKNESKSILHKKNLQMPKSSTMQNYANRVLAEKSLQMKFVHFSLPCQANFKKIDAVWKEFQKTKKMSLMSAF